MVLQASRATVAQYLERAYDVSGIDVTHLLNKHAKLVDDGQMMRSAAWYVGDQIADLEGLEENPDYDEGAEDEEGDDA